MVKERVRLSFTVRMVSYNAKVAIRTIRKTVLGFFTTRMVSYGLKAASKVV